MVWFCSDNGPEGNPQRRGRSQGSAGPFRGRKRSLYEGGVRVPGLLEWPARITRARVTDIPCVTSDYFPTVLDAIGGGLGIWLTGLLYDTTGSYQVPFTVLVVLILLAMMAATQVRRHVPERE